MSAPFPPASPHVLIYCRGGFELDAGEELRDAAAALGVAGEVVAHEEASWAAFIPERGIADLAKLGRGLDFADLVFARQMLCAVGTAAIDPSPGADRVGPMTELVRQSIAKGHVSQWSAGRAQTDGVKGFGTVWIEHPDTNDGKELSRFAESLTHPLSSALKKAGLIVRGTPEAPTPRLHVFLSDASHATVAWAWANQSSPWPLGIPRLKLPADAPSRSTLKLEEAFRVFLSKAAMDEVLREGKTAIDLGAAPGGWTYQFTRRGMYVTAIDNGDMDAAVMASGLVEHRRDDAFKWEPEEHAEWLVCDVVEQPHRVAELMSKLIRTRYFGRCLFNLKLPMIRRRAELAACLEIIRAALPAPGRGGRNVSRNAWQLKAKHLYHDRKEVTVYAGP